MKSNRLIGGFMKSIWGCAALALLFSNAALAEDCGPLKIIGQANMISTQGALLVPATANGVPTKMIIDTGGWYRELSPTLVKTLGLPTSRRQWAALDVTGRRIDKFVTVNDFAIGTFKASKVPFLAPDNGFGRDDIGGLMGPQMLMLVDVDLDFGGKKINFIAQDHCDGKVVYWKTPSYAAVPFTLTDEGHIRLPVELDGKPFTALLDTGASTSAITLRAAEGSFGITKNSPDVTKGAFVNGDTRAQEYKRTFKTLTVGGITFNNPTLSMMPDLMRNHLINDNRPPINSHISISKEAEGLDDVIVGLEELRHLHVYIAYKEQKLYISPAVTPEPPAPTPAAPDGPR